MHRARREATTQPHGQETTAGAGPRRRGDRRVLHLRPEAVSEPRVLPGQPGADRRLPCRPSVADRGGLLRHLRRGHRTVAAGRGDHDDCRRRDLRRGDRHGAGVVCLLAGRDAGLPGVALPAARLGPGARRRADESLQRRRRQGRRVLSLRAAAGADLSLLADQPGHGPDGDPHLDLLLGEPARHARRHRRLRLRGHAARPVPHLGGPDLRLRAARHLPAGRQESARRDQGAQGLREMGRPASGGIRLQHGGDRRRQRRPRLRLHRRGDQGEGGADREAQDGRRLPEHRLRAVEGADPLGQAAQPHRALEGVRHRPGQRELRLRRRDGARLAGGEDGRAARFGRALHGARRRVRYRHREDHLAVDGGGVGGTPLPCPSPAGGEGVHGTARADDEEHRHRRRRAAVRAADPGPGRRRLPDLGHGVEPARAAEAAGRARRRADRLRADAGLRAARLAGHAGRDAAAHPDPRGSRGVDAGAVALRGRGHPRAGRPQGEAVPGRERREGAGRRARRRRCAHSVRRGAGRRRPRREHAGLRARGTRHRRDHARARSRPTPTCRRSTPTSSPAATSPDRSSSRIPPRTRPGMRRSTRCSARSVASGPTTA